MADVRAELTKDTVVVFGVHLLLLLFWGWIGFLAVLKKLLGITLSSNRRRHTQRRIEKLEYGRHNVVTT